MEILDYSVTRSHDRTDWRVMGRVVGWYRRLVAILRVSVVALVHALHAVIGVDEVMLTAALVSLSIGAGQVWPPAAWLVPGIVLLWMFLPTRQPFVHRAPLEKGER